MTANVDIAGVAAIVTGGGGGLGAAICARLARDGWTVVVNDIDAAAVERGVASIAAFGGAALARAQRIRGLEDALLDFNAEGNGARISGEIEFDPSGGIRVEPRFSGQPSVSIAMQRGNIDDASALDDTEPRHTPLEPHRPLVLEQPRDPETSPRQTPLDLDVGDAISAFIDDGRISIEVPTRAGGTGPIGDAEDATLQDIRVGDGALTVD